MSEWLEEKEKALKHVRELPNNCGVPQWQINNRIAELENQIKGYKQGQADKETDLLSKVNSVLCNLSHIADDCKEKNMLAHYEAYDNAYLMVDSVFNINTKAEATEELEGEELSVNKIKIEETEEYQSLESCKNEIFEERELVDDCLTLILNLKDIKEIKEYVVKVKAILEDNADFGILLDGYESNCDYEIIRKDIDNLFLNIQCKENMFNALDEIERRKENEN